MRKFFFTLHLWVAMIVGLFILILGATGCVMAFEPEIDHLLHARWSYVTPRGDRMTLAQMGDRVSRALPGERITAYTLSTSPHISAQVNLERSTAYVDPYTGEILGTRLNGMDFLGYVHQLHLRLLIFTDGDLGKKIMSWAGFAMLFLIVTGLYLWWPVKRFRVQSGKRFWFDLHHAIGIFSFAFLLILTITGMMIGFEQSAVPMFYRMTGSQPSRPPKIPAPPPGAKPITPDQAMEIARAAIPGAAPFAINIPGPKAAYLVRSRFPEDLTPGGRSRVVIDQYTGKVLFTEDSRTAPAGTRMVIINRAIHTGDVFGIPSKALVSLASLMAVVQLTSGLAMWWKRR